MPPHHHLLDERLFDPWAHHLPQRRGGREGCVGGADGPEPHGRSGVPRGAPLLLFARHTAVPVVGAVHLAHGVGDQPLLLGGPFPTAVMVVAVHVGGLLHRALQEMPAVGPLDLDGAHFFVLPLEGGGDGLIGDLGGVGSHELLLHGLLEGVHLPGVAQDLFGQGKEDVQAVDLVPRHHGQVQCDELDLVGLGDPQRLLQGVHEVGEAAVVDELRGVGVELLPCLVEHLEVILSKRLAALLRGHVEVLQDDGDVHVDHDEEGNDDVAAEEADADGGVAAVAPNAGAWVLQVGVTVGGPAVEDGVEEPIPAGRRGDLKEADDAIAKGLEVKHVINARLLLDIGEVGHAEDGVDEHDQEEEEANVEEGGQ